jgi:hypothetical protein
MPGALQAPDVESADSASHRRLVELVEANRDVLAAVSPQKLPIIRMLQVVPFATRAAPC